MLEAPKESRTKPDRPVRNEPIEGVVSLTTWLMSPLEACDKQSIVVPGIIAGLDVVDPSNPTLYANILGALVDSTLQCWTFFGEMEDGSSQLLAIGSTQVNRDDIQGGSSLLIYSLSSIPNVDMELWQEPFRHITEYAKANKCSRVVGYTKSNEIVKMVRFVGGRSFWKMFSLEVT